MKGIPKILTDHVAEKDTLNPRNNRLFSLDIKPQKNRFLPEWHLLK
jgi:hypothetical protein